MDMENFFADKFMDGIDGNEDILDDIRNAGVEQGVISLIKNQYDIDIHYVDFSFDYNGRLNVAVYIENTDEWFKFNRTFFNDLGGVMGNVVKKGELLDHITGLLFGSGILVGDVWVLCYDYSMEYKGNCMVRLIKELLNLRFNQYWYTYDINDDRFYIIIEVEDKTKLRSAVENAESVKTAVHNILDKIDTEGRIEKEEIGYAVGCSQDIIGRDAMHCVNEESLERCYKL
jgi:hypothetical protein